MRYILGFNNNFFMVFLLLFSLMAGCKLSDKFNNKFSNSTTDYDDDSSLIKMKEIFAASGNNHIYFHPNSHAVDSGSDKTLQSIAVWLLNNDCDVLIEGRSNEIGPYNYNISLGLRRAYTVFNYLVNGGIPAYRMKVTSYGREVNYKNNDADNSDKLDNGSAVVVLKKCRLS